MDSFGKKLRECREAKGYSQKELAKLLNTSYTVIGKYERDEMLPSIHAAQKIAKLIDTTVAYLISETNETNLLKDTSMLKRLNDINALNEKDREHVVYTIDHLLASIKTQAVYS